MKRVLIIEDDVVVSSIYRRKYELSGLDVEVALDGVVGLAKVAEFHPDIVQLDLQLPKMNGIDVIKELRSKPEFASLPILVLSSFYKHDMVKEAWKAGATKCVTKIECTPVLALDIITKMIAEAQSGNAAPALAPSPSAPPVQSEPRAPQSGTYGAFAPGFGASPSTAAYSQQPMPPAYPQAPAPYPQQPSGYPQTNNPAAPSYPSQPGAYANPQPAFPAAQMAPSPAQTAFGRPPAQAFAPYPAPAASTASEPKTSAAGEMPTLGASATPASTSGDIRNEFLSRVPEIQTNLRDRANNLIRAKGVAAQLPQLREFYEACRTVANLAGTTGFVRVSHLAEALELLLKELHSKPARVTGSSLRTIAHAADALIALCQEAQDGSEGTPQSGLILAVDDEPISRKVLANALGKANLKTILMDDPHLALKLLNENQFDLIFLDGDMPGMSGFELCKQLRALPSNKSTPVVFVTSLNDFDSRAQSSLAGGNDLIAKPFLMIELAVKALTYLMKPKSQVPAFKSPGQAPMPSTLGGAPASPAQRSAVSAFGPAFSPAAASALRSPPLVPLPPLTRPVPVPSTASPTLPDGTLPNR